MNKNKNALILEGAKKGGGGGGGAVEADNTLRSKSYAHVLDLISEGEIEGLTDGMKSIYLDETPMMNPDGSTNFNARVEFRPGSQYQQPIAGFDTVENEVSVNTEVKHGTPVTRSISNENLDAIRVKVQIPSLTYQNTTNANMDGSSVAIRWELQSGNSGVWNRLRDDTISGKTTSVYEREYYFKLDGAGPWQIRLVRLTADSTKSNVQNRTFFSTYTEVIESKLSYANSAIAGLIVDAENFSSIPARAYDVKLLRVKIPSNYDPVTRSYAGAWDGTFKIAWSDNPAWCLYDIITNNRYGLGREINAGAVDKWVLYTIGRYCDEMIDDGRGGTEPRYRLNCYVQTRVQAYELLKNMASAFAGMLYLSAGTITTLQDRPATPEYLFTNANVAGGAFSYQGSAITARHTVALVTWNDLDDFGRQKVEYVEDLDGIRKFGLIQTEVYAYGCTSKSQAHRYGKSILAAERLLTETVSFSTGIEGVSAYPGMVIQVRDNLRHRKQRKGGRILSWENTTEQSGYKAKVVVDAPLELQLSESHYISIVTPNGTFNSRCAWVNGTAKDELYLVERIPTGETAPVGGATWIVTTEGESGTRLYRVVSVAEDDNADLAITALQYDERKFAYSDNINLIEDPLDSAITIPNEVPAPPDGIHLEVINASRDGETYIGNIESSWSFGKGISKWQVELVREGGNPQRIEVSGAPRATFSGLPEGDYIVRVRSRNLKGQYSQWATSALTHLGFQNIFVNDEVGVVAPFTNIRAANGFLSITLGWEYNEAIKDEIKAVEIWCKEGDINSPDYGQKFRLEQTVPSTATAWTHTDLAPGAERIYQIRSVDKRGNHSIFYPTDRTLKGKSNVDVTPMLNALEASFKATNFFGEIIEEIEKVSDLSELLAQSDLTELQDLAKNINVDINALKEEVRKVGWNLERDSELILRSVILTEKARNDFTKGKAQLTDQVLKIEEGLDTGIARLEQLLAEQLGTSGESLSSRVDQEVSTLVNADQALSERITQLASTYTKGVTELQALLATEEQTRVTQHEALANRVDTIYAELDDKANDALAKIRTEEEARVAKDNATAKTLTELAAVVNNDRATAASGIRAESSARATDKEALTTLINSAKAEFKSADTELNTLVVNEQKARAAADKSQVTSINAVAANLSSEAAALRTQIQNESFARVNRDEALTLLINASTTAYEAGDSVLTTRIQSEEKSRATADTALAQRIDSLTSSLNTKENSLKALIQQESTARVSNDDAISKTVSNLTTTVTNNLNTVKALIQQEATARTTADSANTSALSSMTSRLDKFSTSGKATTSFEAVLAAEQKTRASADEVLTKSVNDMVSRFNTFDTKGKPSTSFEARLAAEEKTRAAADSASATSVTQLTSRMNNVDGANSKVTLEQKFSTTATALGNLEGKYTVKVNSKGHVSGFGLASVANNGKVVSTFAVAADKFVIATPETSDLSTTTTPFQVITTATTANGQTINPGVYIKNAIIQNGAITSAKIGDLQVDTLKIKDQSVTQAVYHQTSGSMTSGAHGTLGNARIMTGAISTSGSKTSGGSFKIVMTASFLLEPVGDVAYFKGTSMTQRAEIIRIDPWGGETILRTGLTIGYSRAFTTALYAYGMGSVVLTYVDTISNSNVGKYQYAIRVYGEGNNALGFRVSNRTMMLQEIKK